MHVYISCMSYSTHCIAPSPDEMNLVWHRRCKSTLMIQFVEGRTVAEDDYMKTLGVSFLEKDIAIRDATVRMSLWDVGACGQAGVRESAVAGELSSSKDGRTEGRKKRGKYQRSIESE